MHDASTEPSRNPGRKERLRNATTRRGRAVTTLTLGGLGVACALLITACGSSSPSPAAATPTTTSSSSSAAPSAPTTSTGTGTSTTSAGSFAAYQNCLQAHGVSLAGAGGGFRGGGATGTSTTGGTRPALTPAQQKARTACASLRPAGGFGGGGSGLNSNNPAFASFQTCLKQHGVQTGSTVSRTSASYQTALAACRSLLPAGTGRGAGGGGAANSTTFAKYQTCLKQHGIQTGATGQSAAKLQTAITACRALLPNAGAANSTTTTTPTTTG